MINTTLSASVLALFLAVSPTATKADAGAISLQGSTVSNGTWSIAFDLVDQNVDTDRRTDCHPTNTWWLEFSKNDQRLDRKLVCSTYSLGPEIIVDQKGQPFILTYVNEGQGSGARISFLVVSVWNGVNLQDVQRLWLGESMTPYLAFDYHVTVETPRDGGLLLRLDLKVEGRSDPQWPTPRPVPQRIEIRIAND